MVWGLTIGRGHEETENCGADLMPSPSHVHCLQYAKTNYLSENESF